MLLNLLWEKVIREPKFPFRLMTLIGTRSICSIRYRKPWELRIQPWAVVVYVLLWRCIYFSHVYLPACLEMLKYMTLFCEVMRASLGSRLKPCTFTFTFTINKFSISNVEAFCTEIAISELRVVNKGESFCWH